MPNKQSKDRTRVTVAMDKALEAKLKAEVERRKKAKDGKADQSGVMSDALEWYLKKLGLLLILDFAGRWLLGSDPATAFLNGAYDAGIVAWWTIKGVWFVAETAISAIV